MGTRREVEIDTKLAELYEARYAASTEIARSLTSVHHTLRERARYVTRHRQEWPTSDADAERTLAELLALAIANGNTRTPGAVMPYEVDSTKRIFARLAAARAKVAECDARMAPLSASFSARPWSRFFLVTSSAGGHIHRSMSCSTCGLTTTYGWLPQISGLAEADAVADQGPRLCSVCFPTAPVEWLAGGHAVRSR